MRRGSVALAMACASLLAPAVAQAQDELSVSSRLDQRRYVAAGERSYVLGFQDGGFQATGFHTQGEMGGVWSQPLKLLDGLWFSVDGTWLGKATRFTSGQGSVRMDGPSQGGWGVSRTVFAPDGNRAALFGLTLTNGSGAERTASVAVDARSELMAAYPWEDTKPLTARKANLPDTGTLTGDAVVFRDAGTADARLGAHDWAAAVGADLSPVSGDVSKTHRGPEGDRICKEADFTCDDGPAGKGTGAQLRYAVTVPAGQSRTLWVGVAGSDAGPDAARAALGVALQDPAAQLAAKRAARAAAGARTRVSLPGDRRLQRGIEWGKQNLLDLTQRADGLRVRTARNGTAYPAPRGTVPSARWIGAGFPDYPWLFATDGEYTAFAAVTVGQFEAVEDHARALRDVSALANPRSGKVVHEVVGDGTVYFGADADAGNTDESAKFPSMVALIWRWSGDRAFLDELYPAAVKAARFVVDDLDPDGDGWPSGLGNVEREGMGDEKLDNAAYLIRGLGDVADMARAKGDTATVRWASRRERRLRRAFRRTWWQPRARQFADSLGKRNAKIQQRHWIGQVPMEAELTDARGRAVPGLASARRGAAAVAKRESACFSGSRPYDRGLFHTGCHGGADRKGEAQVFGLNTSIQAVAEGNYGRLGTSQQRRYTSALVEPMFAEPWTKGTPDEQPGAMPEILPSPFFDPEGDDDANIDRSTRTRAMVMQAWNAYGTMWPVVHQQLGIRPDMGRGRLTIVPQVPRSGRPISATDVRLGTGSLASVTASRQGTRRYRTVVDTGDAPVRTLRVGATVPRGGRWAVTMGGRPVKATGRPTNRGFEITVTVPAGRHDVVITRRRR